MLALRFIKPPRVPGKFVPETVEIDALAADDQALHVLTTEAEVPHRRILNEDGSLGERNDVHCVSIEHTLGIQVSPAAVLQFGDHTCSS
jgi:hypothetical protein